MTQIIRLSDLAPRRKLSEAHGGQQPKPHRTPVTSSLRRIALTCLAAPIFALGLAATLTGLALSFVGAALIGYAALLFGKGGE